MIKMINGMPTMTLTANTIQPSLLSRADLVGSWLCRIRDMIDMTRLGGPIRPDAITPMAEATRSRIADVFFGASAVVPG